MSSPGIASNGIGPPRTSTVKAVSPRSAPRAIASPARRLRSSAPNAIGSVAIWPLIETIRSPTARPPLSSTDPGRKRTIVAGLPSSGGMMLAPRSARRRSASSPAAVTHFAQPIPRATATASRARTPDMIEISVGRPATRIGGNAAPSLAGCERTGADFEKSAFLAGSGDRLARQSPGGRCALRAKDAGCSPAQSPRRCARRAADCDIGWASRRSAS